MPGRSLKLNLHTFHGGERREYLVIAIPTIILTTHLPLILKNGRAHWYLTRHQYIRALMTHMSKGIRVKGSRFRGLGFRVKGLGFRVNSSLVSIFFSIIPYINPI